MATPCVGILGIQGCCRPHELKFSELGVPTRRVLYPSELAEIDALVMPGGESTTMLKAAPEGLWSGLSEFAETKPVWGICAGSILMAQHVENPSQRSLGLLDMTVVRNAYGAQNESFIAPLSLSIDDTEAFDCIFIRAPKIASVGGDVDILGDHDGNPVMVQRQNLLATTFHPELGERTDIHRYFVGLI